VKFAQNWLAGLQAVSTVSGGTFDGTETALSSDITTVIGGSNNDRMTGDDDANNLDGSGGNDWIEGAGGNDILTGGAGTDLFVFNDDAGLDTITDFDAGSDLIDLRDHIAAMDFAGLDISNDVNGDAVIRVTGEGDADAITLTGVSAGSLDADDFIFDDALIG
jgi:Ca2+-binding RTX toxin-like protein